MPRFRYIAVDADGGRVSGELDAVGAREAVESLEAVGLRLESVSALSASDAAAGPTGRRDAEELAARIADVASTGLPLAAGLRALAAESPAGRRRRGLERAAKRIAEGADVAVVLRERGAPPDLEALLKAGLRSGRTAEVLAHYASHSRRIEDLKRRTLLQLGYPAVLVVGAVLLFFAFLVFIVPDVGRVYSDFEMQLPALTSSLLWMSEHAAHMAFVVVLLSYMFWMLPRRSYRKKSGGFWSRFLLTRGVWRDVATARFTQLLALLIESEVPLPQALWLAGEGAGNREVERAARRLAGEVQSGGGTKSILKSNHDNGGGLPATIVRLLTVEKRHATLPDALRAAAGFFANRAAARTRVVTAVCQPAALVFAGALLLFLVLAMFLPLFNFLNQWSSFSL